MSPRKKIAPNRCLGWLERDGSVYILPGRAVEQMGGRLGISDSALYAQLARLGMIASHDPGKYTKQIGSLRKNGQNRHGQLELAIPGNGNGPL